MMETEPITALLLPLSEEQPCGDSLRYDPDYDRLAAARRQDDETLPAGVWQSEPRRADWDEVARLASELLQTRSKDLLIMGWLGEAWIRQRGLPALPQALELMTRALERYPETLHPRIQDGDYDYRAAPLGWMAKHYAMLIADAPLLCCDGAAISLLAWQQGASPALPPPDAQLLLPALDASLRWLQRLNEICRTWPEASAPSFLALEQKIKACQQALRSLLPAAAPPAQEPQQSMTMPISNTATFASREEAYRTLQEIAEYLTRTEPHSPVPYLLRRAAIWGHTPLPELLAELIGEDETARRLWQKLGVLP